MGGGGLQQMVAQGRGGLHRMLKVSFTTGCLGHSKEQVS